MSAGFRRFALHRDQDVDGETRPVAVADGVEYAYPFEVDLPHSRLELPAGWVLLTWRGEFASTVLWRSLVQAMAVHGHDGTTRVVWADGGR